MPEDLKLVVKENLAHGYVITITRRAATPTLGDRRPCGGFHQRPTERPKADAAITEDQNL
jgi:hypothetical protein